MATEHVPGKPYRDVSPLMLPLVTDADLSAILISLIGLFQNEMNERINAPLSGSR